MQPLHIILVFLSLLTSLTAGELGLCPRPQQVTAEKNKFFKLERDTHILLSQVKPETMPNEGYLLEITPQHVRITSSSPSGIFYACQTLKQWLPRGATLSGELGKNPAPVVRIIDGEKPKIPCVTIKDTPRYSWRGFMLDSGRQYHTMDYLKKTIRILAHYKFNTFHWHLTEGHGWRVQIDAYPKLTSIGSNIGPWKEQKGFYTKQQIRELVAYAAEHHITIVPEIDVPGHSNAALIAYPEHTCFRKAPKVETSWSSEIFCGGRESTYVFLNTIFDEICELFPSEYIHIGGDEALKKHWEKCPDCLAALKKAKGKNMHDLQIHMMNRLADHLAKKKRKAICWGDVVTHSGPPLSENITVMWWNYRRHKAKALHVSTKAGRDCIMAPNYYTYLNFPVTPKLPDYKQNRTFDLRMAYETNPVHTADKLPADQQKRVLGINPCLWTDHNLLQHQLDARAYPRILAFAEIGWHQGKREPFNTFLKRVRHQQPRLKKLGAKIGPAMKSDPQ